MDEAEHVRALPQLPHDTVRRFANYRKVASEVLWHQLPRVGRSDGPEDHRVPEERLVVPSGAHKAIRQLPPIGVVVQLGQPRPEPVEVNWPFRMVVVAPLHPAQQRADPRPVDTISDLRRRQLTAQGSNRLGHCQRGLGADRGKPLQL